MARADLTGAKIRLAFADDPSGKEFEEFFRRLLEAERALRHVVGSTQIDGPDKPGSADGGKDCILVVHEPPRRARLEFTEPLTWDDSDPAGKKTYYSLKAGQHWATSVHEDVGYSGHLTGHPNKKDIAPKRPRSSELLPLIAGGHRYVIVVAAETDGGATTLEKVRKALEHHLAEAMLPPPSDWRDKIGFIDANHLAAFVRHNYPVLPPKLDNALGLSWPSELDRFDEWTRRLKRDRPDYVPDDQRKRDIALLNDSKAPRVIRIFGPPGVGKTRLVHEALRQRDKSTETDDLSRPTDAVYYTDRVAAAEDVVYGPWLRDDAGAMTLVVDEVVSSDADTLSRTFLARVPDDRRTRLVLIGVSDEDAREGLDRHDDVLGIRLGDLSLEATRKLVEAELGASVGEREELVGRVLMLAKGFPLFAVLLARALAEDEDALADGQDEAGEWWAAKRVLAGSKVEHGGDADRWRREATVRAMCLLVVIMTGNQDCRWDELWIRHGDALRELIAETCDWKLVKAAYADCFNREILRHVGRSQARYVSPANLARMILNHFLGGGPDDLGPRLSHLPAQLLDRLSTEAKRVDASATAIERLTRVLLAEIDGRRAAGLELAELLDARDILYGAIERIPENTARTLSATVLALERETLAEREGLRHRLRGLLQELVQAPVSQATFADLEHALFRMALVEDELWANNATGIWSSLFLVALSQTHQPWSFRFELLQQRCVSGPEAGRLLAVNAGLSLAAASDERGLGHAPGRTWPMPTEAEYRACKREAWVFLLTLSLDTVRAVASAARKVVAAQLRGCVMDEVVDAELLAELGMQLGAWSVAERRDLSETLADIRRYDEPDVPIHTALTELAAHLDPANFGERLVAWVGSWHPGDWAISDPERKQYERRGDEELAQEGLAAPDLLIEQWPWLRSQAARRQRPFMRTLGELDVKRVFLPSLEGFTPDAPGEESRLLAWYVEGWSLASEGADVDAWLSAQLDGGVAERTAGFVLPFLEPSEQRLAWLIDRIEQGKAQLAEMSAVYRRWAVTLQPTSVLRLLDALAAQPTLVPVGVSLVYELLGLELEPELQQRALDVSSALLEAAAVRRLPALYEHHWARLLEALARHGRGDAVADAVLTLLTSQGNPASLTFVERVLHEVLELGLAVQLWERATSVLDGEQGGLIAWYFARGRVLAQLDAERILDWVGERESRAAIAMEMVNPYGATLPRLPRELLRRFGDEGRVASALASRVRSTPRAMTSLIEFKRRQLANAERWAEDEIVEVRRWATRLAEELRYAIAEDEAHELFRRKLA